MKGKLALLVLHDLRAANKAGFCTITPFHKTIFKTLMYQGLKALFQNFFHYFLPFLKEFKNISL
jgi:hypothetical protein